LATSHSARLEPGDDVGDVKFIAGSAPFSDNEPIIGTFRELYFATSVRCHRTETVTHSVVYEHHIVKWS